MPCRDGGPSDYEISCNHASVIDKWEKRACALLGFLEGHGELLKTFIEQTDWKEAGTEPAELLQWWRSHQRKDIRRKREEKVAREKEKLRRDALKKLSKEEREALGLK
jgi:hypothetical protein